MSASRFRVEVIRTLAALEQLSAAWDELFVSSGCENPFAAPGWPISFARRFVPESELFVVAIYEGEQLAGVAPLRQQGIAPGLGVIRLLGAGDSHPIIETPQLLVDPHRRRAVLRELLHLMPSQGGWAWFELLLAPDQGWLEPQWLPAAARERFALIHKGTRPCVVLDLPETWDDLLAGLKRNVRESIRRATNRLDGEPGGWEVRSESGPGPGLSEATRRLIALNHARSRLAGRVHHPSPIASQRHVDFFEGAVDAEAATGRAEVLTLRLGDEVIAAALVLHTTDVSYLSITGFDPRWWHLSPVTALTAAAIRGAIERGHASFNLSVGADVAKLRWSEQLSLYQDFFVVRDGAGPRAAFGAFTALRALAVFHRETRRHGARLEGRPGLRRLRIGS